MTWIVIYFATLFLVSFYVSWRGGAPERWVAAIFVTASLASAIQPQPAGSYEHVFSAIAVIDLIMLLAVFAIALAADRYWPMLIAALQLVTLGLHGIRSYDLKVLPYAYWLLIGKISYLMLIILLIATVRHQNRKRRGDPEFAWTKDRHARHSGVHV